MNPDSREPLRSAAIPAPVEAGLASLGADFDALLACVRPQIERRLEVLWDDKLARVRRYGPEVVAMASAARELTLRGGKRFRAALLAAAYGGVDPSASIEPALQAGVALELLQTYLLIQDDWMDGDVTRRGGPSVHALLTTTLGEKLGPASAILASDLTWSLAISVLARADAAPERVVAALRLFADVHDDVVIGQQIDLLGRAEDVEAMHDLKTGSYTVRGPLALGATLAGASEATLSALARFAAPLGVAFQLRDDLLGTFGTEAETGKPVGNDLRAGKRTAILAEADARLDAGGRAAIDRVLGKTEATAGDVAIATAALDACGARAAVAQRLEALCDEAGLLATGLPIASAAQRMLGGAATALRVAP